MAAEGLAALAAEEGLLAGVDTPVLQEVGAPGEGLATLTALVGLLSRVPPPVQCQGRASLEGLAALATRERAAPGTRAPMPDSAGLHAPHAAVRRGSFCGKAGLGQEGTPPAKSLLRHHMAPSVLLCGTVPGAGGLTL